MESYEKTDRNINSKTSRGWETLALIIYVLAHLSVIFLNFKMGQNQGQIQGTAKKAIGTQIGILNEYCSSSQDYFDDQSYNDSVNKYLDSVQLYVESVNHYISDSEDINTPNDGSLAALKTSGMNMTGAQKQLQGAQQENEGLTAHFRDFSNSESDLCIQLGEGAPNYNNPNPKNPDALSDNIGAMISVGNTAQVASGTLAQLILILSAFITLAVHKKGYITSLILNLLSTVSGIFVIVNTGSLQPVPGFINTVSAIVLISIIYGFSNKIIAKNNEISKNYQQLIETNRIVKETDEKLSYLAYYDILTGLPNRQKYLEKLDEAITNSANNSFTTILADLDNFKQINDTYGLNVGDIVLSTYAEKLKAYCQTNIFLARIGGDEFGFIIEGSMTEANILNHIEKIQNILSEPIQINDIMLTSTSSFGIASYPNNAVSSNDLMKCLDSAIYYAKSNGKNRPCFYEQN